MIAFLGRPERDRLASGHAVKGKRVLITGAGGSIGSALVHRIAEHGPEHLVLFGHGETALYTVDKTLPGKTPRTVVLGDLRDAARIRETVCAYLPDIVIHAAAIKHVGYAEAHPDEAALTNVVGTVNVLRASEMAGASFVLISTDKAVDAVCVMGATKRTAELICASARVVRLVNVLGSSGSVLPLFERQAEKGGPLTVTDSAAERWFMTPGEAAETVLRALELDGHLFAPEPGEPVRIGDLAKRVIADRDIAIDYTGLRPGERRTERLFHTWECPKLVGGLMRDDG